MNNRLHNSTNPYQGPSRKVLCLCSAGLLRSPTTAVVLSQEPYNFNTRAAGVNKDYALVPVDEVLIHWADEIVCVEKEVYNTLMSMHKENINPGTVVKVLHLPDRFAYRDPELVELIKEQYNDAQPVP